MGRKQRIDQFFKVIFTVISTFSVLALLAIIFFVFIQGAIPFFTATAEAVHVIPFGISSFTLDGDAYTYSSLPRDAKYVELGESPGFHTLGFQHQDQEVSILLDVDLERPLPAHRVNVVATAPGVVKYTEEYVYEVTYPGKIAGQIRGFYLAIPQQPTGFFSQFLLDTEWRPTYNKRYGIFTMVVATLFSTFGAILVGVPLALLTAVFLSEFLPPKVGGFVRGAVDLLAGIPSVVYGFFGLMVVVPLIKKLSGAASGNGLLAAMFILALMMLPTVISLAETSMRAVPQMYREGSLALGASKMQTAWRIVVPAAKSGIFAGAILGTSRAVGETMAVIMVAGNSPQIPRVFTDGIRTLTATIALEMGYAQGRHNRILFSVGIVLFLIILVLNGIVLALKSRMMEDA